MFDYGTHVPRQTGHTEIDEILFGNLDTATWRRFRNINAGNVSLFKVLYPYSAAPYLPPLPTENDWIETLPEPINSPEWHNLEQQLLTLFGEKLVKTFFAPCIQSKLGSRLVDLAPDSHKLIGLPRLILGDADTMRELKKVPWYDSILSFADQSEGDVNITKLLSKQWSGYRSVGRWIG